MRILLFTGKGGVGKTTIAAATALKAAEEGYKTLILSTDPAHSLADALGQALGPEPQEIAPNLFAQELDVYYSMKKHWENIRQLMQSVMRWQGVQNIVAEELSALPGMEEGSAFLWLEEYYREKAFDLIIVDSAPTGETLTLLSLPQVTQSWVMRAFPGQKLAMRGFGTMVRTMTGIPLDKGLSELDELFEKLERIQKIMHDPEICSIRIVLNPERMVINEAKRAYTYLQLFGYQVDAVVVNRIFPEELAKGPFAHYIEKQKEYLEEINTSFSHLPVLRVEHQGREVFGRELLSEIAQSAYAERDPAGIFYSGSPMEISETPKGYVIRLKLPFADGQLPEVKKFGEELIITLGNQRRSIFLPRFANYLQLEGSDWKEDHLEIALSK
jgi:arsenite-transporting ATPase